jgi:hypothetical protein
MMNEKDPILEIYLKEYEALKAEQSQRIGFRDNLLYVTLGVFGGIISYAVSKETNYHALLVLPWVCLILGWTYLVNDEKISAIGRYIRLTLIEKINSTTGQQDNPDIFGWEIAHRNDGRRERRKIEQLIIDEVTFVFSGIAALLAFWILVPKPMLAMNSLALVELIFLLVLGVEICIYADLQKGK